MALLPKKNSEIPKKNCLAEAMLGYLDVYTV